MLKAWSRPSQNERDVKWGRRTRQKKNWNICENLSLSLALCGLNICWMYDCMLRVDHFGCSASWAILSALRKQKKRKKGEHRTHNISHCLTSRSRLSEEEFQAKEAASRKRCDAPNKDINKILWNNFCTFSEMEEEVEKEKKGRKKWNSFTRSLCYDECGPLWVSSSWEGCDGRGWGDEIKIGITNGGKCQPNNSWWIFSGSYQNDNSSRHTNNCSHDDEKEDKKFVWIENFPSKEK